MAQIDCADRCTFQRLFDLQQYGVSYSQRQLYPDVGIGVPTGIILVLTSMSQAKSFHLCRGAWHVCRFWPGGPDSPNADHSCVHLYGSRTRIVR